MTAMNREDEPSGGPWQAALRLWGFWESGQRVLSVLAGLALATLFCLTPFTPLGADGPWYFWVGSGVMALAASFLLAWVFFPPSAEGRTIGGERER